MTARLQQIPVACYPVGKGTKIVLLAHSVEVLHAPAGHMRIASNYNRERNLIEAPPHPRALDLHTASAVWRTKWRNIPCATSPT